MVYWFILGFMVGLATATIYIAAYGNAELNEQIRLIRKSRHKLAKAKLELQVRKFLFKQTEKGYTVKITPTAPPKSAERKA